MTNINENSNTDIESIKLYKIYRKKLQSFLKNSNFYHPENIMKYLPNDYLHEFALIFSKLNKHEEVLRIYIHQLQDIDLAEKYCHTNYEFMINELNNNRMLKKPPSLNASAQTFNKIENINYQKLKFEQNIFDEKLFMSLIGDSNNVYICLFKVTISI